VTDPYRNPQNVAYVGVVLDANNALAESNEHDNAPIGVNDLATVQPERHIRYDGFNWVFDGGGNTPIGPTHQAGLGNDELIGQYDIDIFAFDVASAGQRLAFDIDAIVSAPGLDTHVRLYPMQGNVVNTGALLASNDNARAPGEPATNNGESYLAHTFAAPGRYALVVNHVANANVNPMTLLDRQPGAEGQYALTITDAPAQPVTVTSTTFEFLAAPQRLRFDFSANVQASLAVSDLQVRNLTTNQLIPSDKIALGYDAQTNRATFTFPGYAYGALPDGKYRATLPAGSVSDPQGNPLAGDVEIVFEFLNGDANRDGRVNLTDFNILAANFGTGGRDFGQGDFTYDGLVNLSDFNVLAGRFGTAIAPDPLPPQSGPTFGELADAETDEWLELTA
jgi:hypothetical protein